MDSATWSKLDRAHWRKIKAGIRHNMPGQLNVSVLDAESPCTSFGQHNRLIACGSACGKFITVREDHETGPRKATHEEIKAYALRQWTELGVTRTLRFSHTFEDNHQWHSTHHCFTHLRQGETMKYCVECTDRSSKTVGNFIRDEHRQAFSPVFPSLVGLFTWMKEHGYESVPGGIWECRRTPL